MAKLASTSQGPNLHELLARLSVGIEALAGLGSWERFLMGQARFHRYSYGNTLLILAQCPEARSIAGFSTWRRLGRSVKRGERAIWIVAPLIREAKGSSTRPPELQGFRRVAVFDVSQTEGDDLFEICRPLEGADDGQHFAALRGVAQQVGFVVVQAEMPPGMFGDCTYATKEIRVSNAASPAQRVKTLVHEISHAILHEGCSDRPLAELEAESTAYIVCQHLGLDSSCYSFGYVATWAGGTDRAIREIRQSCERITSTARKIIDLLPGDASGAETSQSGRSGLRLAAES